jgi:hypothetical protein
LGGQETQFREIERGLWEVKKNSEENYQRMIKSKATLCYAQQFDAGLFRITLPI